MTPNFAWIMATLYSIYTCTSCIPWSVLAVIWACCFRMWVWITLLILPEHFASMVCWTAQNNIHSYFPSHIPNAALLVLVVLISHLRACTWTVIPSNYCKPMLIDELGQAVWSATLPVHWAWMQPSQEIVIIYTFQKHTKMKLLLLLISHLVACRSMRIIVIRQTHNKLSIPHCTCTLRVNCIGLFWQSCLGLTSPIKLYSMCVSRQNVWICAIQGLF